MSAQSYLCYSTVFVACSPRASIAGKATGCSARTRTPLPRRAAERASHTMHGSTNTVETNEREHSKSPAASSFCTCSACVSCNRAAPGVSPKREKHLRRSKRCRRLVHTVLVHSTASMLPRWQCIHSLSKAAIVLQGCAGTAHRGEVSATLNNQQLFLAAIACTWRRRRQQQGMPSNQAALLCRGAEAQQPEVKQARRKAASGWLKRRLFRGTSAAGAGAADSDDSAASLSTIGSRAVRLL